jgi:hypothetical protein
MYPIFNSEFSNHYREADFSQPDIEVLFSTHGMRSPIHRTIDASKMTPIYSVGGMSKYVDPGYFHGYDSTVGDNGFVRVLPRAWVQTASAKTIAVPAAKIFVKGDSLHLLDTGVLIGKIANVDPVTNKIELAELPTAPIAIGDRIGVQSIIPLGMTIRGIDLVEGMPEQGLYTSASVYKRRLPYWDFELEEKFREITLV